MGGAATFIPCALSLECDQRYVCTDVRMHSSLGMVRNILLGSLYVCSMHWHWRLLALFKVRRHWVLDGVMGKAHIYLLWVAFQKLCGQNSMTGVVLFHFLSIDVSPRPPAKACERSWWRNGGDVAQGTDLGLVKPCSCCSPTPCTMEIASHHSGGN